MKTLLFAAAAFAAVAAPASAQNLDSKGNPFFASAYHDFIRDPVRVAVPGRVARIRPSPAYRHSGRPTVGPADAYVR